MDRSVKPGADFFLYANGSWYAKAQIPPDRNSTGVFTRLTEEIEKRSRGLLEEAARPGAAPGSTAQKIGDYYASYLDEAAIEKQGVAPLAPAFDRIAKIKDASSLATYLGATLRADVDPLNATDFQTGQVLGLFVEQDLNDPSRYAPYLLQGGLGMPDRSYYLDDAPRMQALRTAYLRHLTTNFRLAGIANPEVKAQNAFALEKKIAQSHGTRADSADVGKSNNPWPRAEFDKRAPGMNWTAYLSAAGLERQPSFIVWHPSALTGLAALVKSQPIEVWKQYLMARAIDHAAMYLPKAFVDESFAFYSKELRGTESPAPRWRRAANATDDALGEAVGKVYVEKYFPPETKRMVEGMVHNLVEAFGRRIDALTWMSPETKRKAKEKLATLKVGVGYPDKWRDYSGLSVVRGDVLGNFERAELFEYRRNVQKLGRPIDRDEWAMLPHVVNAVNLPVRNSLNFPAATLVPPFFDANATAAANYGSIGMTIGHEISHSFDDQGAQFDARGRFVDWWTPDDLSHFQASGAALATQFSAYKPFPDKAIDGKLTLSENIADLAGLAVAYDAWRTSLKGEPAPVQDGLTGDQQFFISYAQGWQSKERDEILRIALTTDGHAPDHYRVFTVRNIDAWYSAFDIAPTDPLFLAPNARVRVW
ncbi:M13 family metallopeptidase [Pendulispora brunnea]|uniref:M13 family metallopeptidase n=1 Tax=Pendulispora brunnea TaxID=2905690 RepID=A0ABZ2KDI7_9BACT